MAPAAWGQNRSVEGFVFDRQNNVVPGAVIQLKSASAQKQALTNGEGFFQIRDVAAGAWLLTVTHVGYAAYEDSVVVASDDLKLTIRLDEKVNVLGDVQVVAKSDSRRAAERSIMTAVANAREVSYQSVTVTELMGRTSGVRIRQTGGLGSAADVSINGYQGRSVRYFKNGVPLSYLQEGYSITSVPVNALDRVEVYKGVLPASLGADALGGAVNLVTKEASGRLADVSFEAGSFNTYRVAANGFYSDPDNRWFVGAEGFLNYSKNNYRALVKVTDPDTRNQRPERVTLFHNQYNGHYAEVSGGFRDRAWADELRFGLALFEVGRQQQHPALMTDPYGAVKSSQNSLVPTLRYRKAFWGGRLSLDQFLAYNVLNVNRSDTLRGRFDWYGNFTPNPLLTGESRQPALSDVDLEHITSRTNIGYRLSASHTLEGNLVYTSVSRTGEDPYGPRFYGTDIDVLSAESSYRKLVAVAGLDSRFLDDRLETVLMLKLYHYSSEGVEAWQGRAVTLDDVTVQSASEPGIGAAIKYSLDHTAFVRLSGEMANRLPEQDELFGDGVWIVPNFNLSPERSVNVNLGFRKVRPTFYGFELNTFFRKSGGMILLVPVQPPYAQYANMEDVRGFGVEGDLSLHLPHNLTATLNATWQDLRLTGIPSGMDQWKDGARLRNTPYFFYNAGLSGSFRNVITSPDRLRAYLYYSFVREFYLETIPRRLEPDGFLGLAGSAKIQTDLIIPDQHYVNAGLAYTPAGGIVSVGLEAKNILDADLYDNYRVQRPGRSFHLKISCQIKGKS